MSEQEKKTPENQQGADTIAIRLLEKRIVPVFGMIDDKKAEGVLASLLYLAAEDAQKPVTLYINSNGGTDADVLGIYDLMRGISCPVYTVCVGKACGMAAFLLSGGEKDHRSAYENCEIMLTQVRRDQTYGQASDIELATTHLLAVKKRVNTLLAKNCGKNDGEVEADLERACWMDAAEAVQFGLIDRIEK